MSEQLSSPEQPRITEAQEETLRVLCDRYGVQYAAEHYYVYPQNSTMMAGWCEGWLGGAQHANPEYATPEEPAGEPSLYVGVDPEGRAHS